MCGYRFIGEIDRGLPSSDFRRLSTSSTVRAKVGGGIGSSYDPGTKAAFPPIDAEADGAIPTPPPPVPVESKLALRRRLAPLVNFSVQVEPSFRHSSVIGTQLGQQARSGTVWSSGRR